MWKSKHYLNAGKCVTTFADKGEGCIDFTKQKYNNITETVQLEYSNQLMIKEL